MDKEKHIIKVKLESPVLGSILLDKIVDLLQGAGYGPDLIEVSVQEFTYQEVNSISVQPTGCTRIRTFKESPETELICRKKKGA